MQAYQTLLKSSNSLCFTAEVDGYLGKASMLNKKSGRRTLQLLSPALNILIAQGNGDDTGAAGGYPDSVSKQGAE